MNCPSDGPEGTTQSRYAMVIAVAKRAKQIREGAPKLVECKSKNPITVAIQEIAAGKVNLIIPTPEEIEAAERAGTATRPTAVETAELLRVPLEEEESSEVIAPEADLMPEDPSQDESEDEEPEEDMASEADGGIEAFLEGSDLIEPKDEISEDTPEEEE